MHSQTKLNENFAQNKKPTAASCDVPKRFGAWDPATQVHGNHISNGGLSGGWRECFTPAVEAHVRKALGGLLQRYGYEWD